MPATASACHPRGRRFACSMAAMVMSLSLAPWPLAAQTSSAATADQIRARAARLKELRDLLNDREPTVRLAAFSELVNSPDPTSQELGFEAGFNSADGAIRALALRKRLARASTISVEVLESGGEWVAKTMKEGKPTPVPPNFGWNVIQVDESAGVLKLHERRELNPEQLRNVQSRVMTSGLTMVIATRGYRPDCDGTLVMGEGNILTGMMACWASGFEGPGGEKVPLKVRMRVN